MCIRNAGIPNRPATPNRHRHRPLLGRDAANLPAVLVATAAPAAGHDVRAGDEAGPSRRSLCQTLRPITEGVVMARTRVHNLNISLDGYAAGGHVTFDAPIGGAERLFQWFDGRVI